MACWVEGVDVVVAVDVAAEFHPVCGCAHRGPVTVVRLCYWCSTLVVGAVVVVVAAEVVGVVRRLLLRMLSAVVDVEEAAVAVVVFAGLADASSGKKRMWTGCSAICCGIVACKWSRFCMLASVRIGLLVDVVVVVVVVLVAVLSLAWGLETFLVAEKLVLHLYFVLLFVLLLEVLGLQ